MPTPPSSPAIRRTRVACGHAATDFNNTYWTAAEVTAALLQGVSVPGSIHYVVLPGLCHDAVLERLHVLGWDEAWWRLPAVG
jgi:hypothetical protein